TGGSNGCSDLPASAKNRSAAAASSETADLILTWVSTLVRAAASALRSARLAFAEAVVVVNRLVESSFLACPVGVLLAPLSAVVRAANILPALIAAVPVRTEVAGGAVIM